VVAGLSSKTIGKSPVPVVVYDKTKADGIALEKLGTERLWLALKEPCPRSIAHAEQVF
jgi:hypothetical protein